MIIENLLWLLAGSMALSIARHFGTITIKNKKAADPVGSRGQFWDSFRAI